MDADAEADDEMLLSQQRRAANIKAMISGNVVVKRRPCLPFFSVPKALTKAFKPPWKREVEASSKSDAGPVRKMRKKRRFLGIRRSRMKPISMKNLSFVRHKRVAQKMITSMIPTLPTQNLCLMDIVNLEHLVKPVAAANRLSSLVVAPAIDPLEAKGPKEWKPLVLWEGPEGPTVEVAPILCKWLRPHQREGVQFLVECVCGLRDYEGCGCILADDMGLGKTLQAITLTYTVLKQMPLGLAPLKRVLVICPTSLIGNWDDEFRKWLGTRVKTIALNQGGNHSLKSFKQFIRPTNDREVLIVSYETFRMNVELFEENDDCIDLIICDEAHRLKNGNTLTSKALSVLKCRRRVLLSGTPMQNKLDEFYAMVNFTNPDLLGSIDKFRKHYERPIEEGREPGCTEKEEQLGNSRAEELQTVVDQFIIRRGNELLAKHLPDKIVQVVCVKMTELQAKLYRHLLDAKERHTMLTGKQTGSLQTVNALKKICNHPWLVFQDARKANLQGKAGAHGFDSILSLFPEAFRSGRGGRANAGCFDPAYSGKFALMMQMLWRLRTETDDRIVIVSNYTQTLELFVQLARKNRWPFIKLDGSTNVKKRTDMVRRFNDPKENEFIFLLSSKAGGCGLNLIGGNRLVLFDPDWNPATDKQAAARVWRDGQKKRVFIYRFLATGSIEEKIFQRQISKDGLSNAVVEKSYNPNLMSAGDLKDIFSFDSTAISNTHENLKCRRCAPPGATLATSLPSPLAESMSVSASSMDKSPASMCLSTSPVEGDASDMSFFEESGGLPRALLGNCSSSPIDATEPTLTDSQAAQSQALMPFAMCRQAGEPTETELLNWAHHSQLCDLKDNMLQVCGKDHVSFVFELEVLSEMDKKVAAPTAAAPAPASTSSSSAAVPLSSPRKRGTLHTMGPPKRTTIPSPGASFPDKCIMHDDGCDLFAFEVATK